MDAVHAGEGTAKLRVHLADHVAGLLDRQRLFMEVGVGCLLVQERQVIAQPLPGVRPPLPAAQGVAGEGDVPEEVRPIDQGVGHVLHEQGPHVEEEAGQGAALLGSQRGGVEGREAGHQAPGVGVDRLSIGCFRHGKGIGGLCGRLEDWMERFILRSAAGELMQAAGELLQGARGLVRGAAELLRGADRPRRIAARAGGASRRSC